MMNALKTTYKDDKYTGKRKYILTQNIDGTISLDDTTTYEENGDIFSSYDINKTNEAINVFYTEFKNKNVEVSENLTSINKTVSENLTKITAVKTAVFTVSAWAGSGPYTQTVSVPGITAADIPTPGIIYPSTLTETLKAQIDKSAGMITKLETVLGGIKATCAFKKPVADFTIGLKGV